MLLSYDQRYYFALGVKNLDSHDPAALGRETAGSPWSSGHGQRVPRLRGQRGGAGLLQ